MSEITKGEQYHPLFRFSTELADEQKPFCFDQAKTNLFWLVEPRVDTEGLDAAKNNTIAKSIDQWMDGTTRKALQGMPMKFLAYWSGLDGEPMMSEHWPEDYRDVMKARASLAQARLLGRSEVGNVVTVNFRRTA